MKLKPVAEQVIVITGGSSGIGLATAKRAARMGARLVLAARTRPALAKAADMVAQAGGQAAFVVADVARRTDVDRIAEEAVKRFGGFDSWVNDAGVMVWGKVGEVPEEDMRQLFETNFWGMVHGSEVAIAYLRERGGALINVGSVESDRAFPLQAAYSASKHAVKGFTDALRMELAADGAPVSVTLVKPASIGTPMPQHGRDFTGREPRFPPPVYAPEEVAATILRACERPVRDAFVGGSARLISTLGSHAPGTTDWISRTFLLPQERGKRPATPTDNLYEGRSEARVHGDHQGSLIRPSLYSRAARNPGATMAIAAAAVGLGALLLRRGRVREGA
ncbi:SDR family oxidoreductase [Sphingosinicella terrae]|uniref:SDR family oxidoreductase n=1 Tax=Sphingosinicella terrae TaxID=2172047 RepID=UPI000E0D862B|nr:SDR family oxidoreductase [Sphingosinicella terrae]